VRNHIHDIVEGEKKEEDCVLARKNVQDRSGKEGTSTIIATTYISGTH